MLYTIVYFCGLHGTPVIIIVLDFLFFFGNTFIPISFLDSVIHYYAYINVLQEYYNIRIIICPYYYKQSSVYIINTFNFLKKNTRAVIYIILLYYDGECVCITCIGTSVLPY